MKYYVYMLKTKSIRPVTYVGYTNNLKRRIALHNSGRGAKFTKGRKWRIIYSKKYNSKSIALREEYKLKKDHKKRKKIKKNYLLKNDKTT